MDLALVGTLAFKTQVIPWIIMLATSPSLFKIPVTRDHSMDRVLDILGYPYHRYWTSHVPLTGPTRA